MRQPWLSSQERSMGVLDWHWRIRRYWLLLSQGAAEKIWIKSSRYRLILQCQSKTSMLRSWLDSQGWRIAEERVLKEGRFLYTVMEVWWQPDHARLEPGECWFPAALLENPSDQVPAYFAWVKKGLEITLAHQADAEKQTALDYLNALAANPDLSFLTEV